MRKTGLAHRAALVLSVCGLSVPAVLAQDQQIQIVRDVGLTDDLPYAVYYPNVLQSIDDGNSQTILTLQPTSQKFFQCDVFVVQGGEEGWNADKAASALDVGGIESSWAPDFPGFKLTNQGTTSFSSGPAVRYEGQSDNSPMSVPVNVIHTEAVDNGRTYAIECIYDRTTDADARPLVDFIVANFSTKSDGQCCINPQDNRG